jgi:prophage maintenance system killer protein
MKTRTLSASRHALFRSDKKLSVAWRGNKRTASQLTLAFLELNGYSVRYEISEMLEMVLAVESDDWKVDEIENWLRTRVGKI